MLTPSSHVAAILCEQAQNFKEFRAKDRVLKPLKKVLTVLNIFPSAADLGAGCRQGTSVSADRVFNVSDPHPIASPARESNTDWPRYSTLRMYLYLVSECACL